MEFTKLSLHNDWLRMTNLLLLPIGSIFFTDRRRQINPDHDVEYYLRKALGIEHGSILS